MLLVTQVTDFLQENSPPALVSLPSVFEGNFDHSFPEIEIVTAVKVKVLAAQLCPTLCDPMDCSSPGSSIHGIFQARVLELGAIPYVHLIFLAQLVQNPFLSPFNTLEF